MPTDAHNQAVRSLADLGPLRVWSVLVTVFGDLAPHDPLDGPTLSAIMGAIGIKPEATRVALHRLRSDGWIVSRKQGRTSLHSLTDQGQRDSAAASPRIYAAPDEMGRGAYALVTQDASAPLDPTLFAQIAPRVYLTADATPLPEGAMQMAPMDLPPWLGAQLESPSVRDAYKALHAVLMDIDAELCANHLTPLDVAVIRVMIVHAWRRLTLRHPDLPRASHSPDWRGHDCRTLVTALLTRFQRPDLDMIKAA